MIKLKEIFSIEKNPVKGLVPLEWAVIIYMLFTMLVMLFMRDRLHDPEAMLMFRLKVVVLMSVIWAAYRLVPCPAVMFLRVAVQIYLLGEWYPDVYEFNRLLPNLDHIFASIEQSLFSCQPALLFSRYLPWGIVSEPLDMGYTSYYPIILFTILFYFLYRRQQFQYSAFIVMASFFVFYMMFIFIPVAGPMFYYQAIGIDLVEQGVFPAIGNYFETHNDLSADMLPSPGWQGGPMWKLVDLAHEAGERPSAAFPSSHVSVTTVCLLLLWRTGNRKVFYRTLPFGILMFFATVYIQAHYAIDAIAGLVSGIIVFYILHFLYKKCQFAA